MVAAVLRLSRLHSNFLDPIGLLMEDQWYKTDSVSLHGGSGMFRVHTHLLSPFSPFVIGPAQRLTWDVVGRKLDLGKSQRVVANGHRRRQGQT